MDIIEYRKRMNACNAKWIPVHEKVVREFNEELNRIDLEWHKDREKIEAEFEASE